MSNILNIEITESRIAGTNGPFEFNLIAADGYGSAIDSGFPSLQALMEAYPTRMEILEWIENKNEFAGGFECKGNTVILDSISGISFSGYPEDNSIAAIRNRDFENNSSE